MVTLIVHATLFAALPWVYCVTNENPSAYQLWVQSFFPERSIKADPATKQDIRVIIDAHNLMAAQLDELRRYVIKPLPTPAGP